ncbi:MAG: MFS transporter [Dictyoglomus sp.]|nr:MFS transporter [Dictyoglomus sp.]MDW8188500.1 MFS transporter [Dictyoglomus sp.]
MKRNIFLVRGFFFVFFSAWSFIFSFIPVYLRDKGFSIGEIGIFASISSLVGALTQIFIGYFSDKIGKRKPFIILGLLGLAFIYFFIFPKINSFWGFLLLYPLIGVFINSVITSSNVLVIDLSLEEKIGRDYASTRIWGSIGFFILTTIIGIFPILTRPQYMFPSISLIYLLGLILILFIKEPKLKAGIKALSLRDIKEIIFLPKVRIFLLFYFFYFTSLVGASSNVNLLIKYLGGTNQIISFAYSASSASEIPFMILWGNLSDKIGRRPILLFSSFILPIRIFLYSIIKNPFYTIPIQLMHSLTFAIIGTIPVVYINDLVPPEKRATAQGILSMISALSSTFGPLLSGITADILGISGMYLFLTFISGISTFIGVISLKESKTNTSLV